MSAIRDLEAIARDANVRGHAEGWGGTIVKVEAAWAVVEHIESRISWCVWQLMEDKKDFDFDEWLQRWTSASEPQAAGRSPSGGVAR